jgi:hypothetical protein
MEPLLFASDNTFRWSCRQGDYLIWFRFNIFADENQLPKVMGMWVLQDGNFVTITNRRQDLPPWFELHPLETSGSLVSWMQAKLNSGYKPSNPTERDNLWRVFAGDRLAWVGPSRPDLKGEDGVLSLVDFRENALVIGEPFHPSSGSPLFGSMKKTTPEDAQRLRNGLLAACRLGIPRTVAADDQWRMG